MGMESAVRPLPSRAATHSSGRGHEVTDPRVELKTLGRIDLSEPVGPGAEGPQGVGDLPSRAGADAGLQVDLEVLLGEVGFSGMTRHLGYQSPTGIAKGLPSPPFPKAASPMVSSTNRPLDDRGQVLCGEKIIGQLLRVFVAREVWR